jgi:hypothetical protein
MSETVLGARVPKDLHTRFRTKAARQGQNISDYFRDVIARHLGFSSFENYLHIAEENPDYQNEESPIVDLSEGALAPYPPHSTRVTILRDAPASPLMDLIEHSDLPDGSAGDTE